MIEKDASELLANQIETLRGAQLLPEERDSIDLWTKGRALAQLQANYGWDVLCEMLQAYPQSAVDQLLRITPGDNDRILAAHAVAYALSDFYVKFRQDVDAAVLAARKTPPVVKKELRNSNQVPPESL